MVKQSSRPMVKGKRKVHAGPPPDKSKPSAKSKEVEVGPTGRPNRRPDQPKKIKLRDQKVIPVPQSHFAGKDGSSDEMLDLGDEEDLEMMAGPGKFLAGMDRDAVSRSTKETRRLHELSKSRDDFPQKLKQKARLPSPGSAMSLSDYDIDSDAALDVSSGDEDDGVMAEGSGTSGLEDDEDEDEQNGEDILDDTTDDAEASSGAEEVAGPRKRKAREMEAEYEQSGRTRWAAPPPKPEEDSVEVGRLPIKLANGQVQKVEGTTRVPLPPSKKSAPEPDSESEEVEPVDDVDSDDGAQVQRMAGKKGRFGRMGVGEIVGTKGWKSMQRLEAAKEQIAAIGAEVMAGGELVDISPLLTRLATFALATVPSPEEGQPPLPVPASIRGLAFLSQLAVYKDIAPGYRIRKLTAAEEAEKVRDEVKRLREGEKMLVRSYEGYLRTLEAEIKRRTPLASLALRCLCDILSSSPHFNFSEQVMGILVGRLGRRSWDQDSEVVSKAFIDVLRADVSALYSKSLVYCMGRTIKEQKFQVHPNILSCLLHLRLRGELDALRQGKNSRSNGKGRDRAKGDVAFKSEVRKKWQTKNQKKREKELKEVAKEMAEAEAEVDKEVRAQTQTEIVKNLFVLYFSILKRHARSPLLPAALEGISHFAHLINTDMFRDLLAVLRQIIQDQHADDNADEQADISVDPVGTSQRVRGRLLAIVTAFDVLSGQGEALNIDLGDFINALFGLLRPLALDTGIEDPPSTFSTDSAPADRPLQRGPAPPKVAVRLLPTSALVFRCLHSIFFSRHALSASAPPARAAAFAKRLAECSLLFPPDTAKQALDFARSLMVREPKLEAMLDTEERTYDGMYKPEMDDPQLVNAFATSLCELEILSTRHWDRRVRTEATKLRDGNLV